jgi:hypothetical protein
MYLYSIWTFTFLTELLGVWIFPSSRVLGTRNTTFRKLFPSSGEGKEKTRTQLGTYQISETSCFYSQEHRTMEKVRNPSNSVCYTPSSVPFKIHFSVCWHWIVWCSCIYTSVVLTVNNSSLVFNVARGNVVGWGTRLQAGKSRIRIPMRLSDFVQHT